MKVLSLLLLSFGVWLSCFDEAKTCQNCDLLISFGWLEGARTSRTVLAHCRRFTGEGLMIDHPSGENNVTNGNHCTKLSLLQRRSTLPKTNMDPENGALKDCFPLQTSGVQVPC